MNLYEKRVNSLDDGNRLGSHNNILFLQVPGIDGVICIMDHVGVIFSTLKKALDTDSLQQVSQRLDDARYVYLYLHIHGIQTRDTSETDLPTTTTHS